MKGCFGWGFDCFGYGLCIIVLGLCYCRFGWFGVGCYIFQCVGGGNCSGYGICDGLVYDFLVCVLCDLGYMGEGCN